MIDPRGLTLLQWADAVILSVGDAWSFDKLPSEDQWHDWAVGFVRASPFTQRNVPDPYEFSDWRDWAMRAYPFLEGSG